RTFTADEDNSGNNHEVVLSYGLWQRRFGSDEKIVGQSIIVNTEKYTVIGVMPRDFQFPNSAEMWIPLALDLSKETRGNHYLSMVGRLKPGVTVSQGQTDLSNVAKQLSEEHPNNNKYTGVYIIALHDRMVKIIRPALIILFAAVGLVLMIACANVAILLLSRTASRKKEIAVRTALGASRWRLIRQLLTESMVLSLTGGGLGLLLSLWATSLLTRITPGNIPRINQIGIDHYVLGFTFAAAVLSGIVFGLAPAIQASTTNLQETLKESGRSSAVGFRRQWLRNMLVVSEIAVALVLLIGAGLLIKSFLKLSNINPGFRPEGVLTMQFTMSQPRYNDSNQRVAFAKDILQRLSVLPGVRSVGATNELPFQGSITTTSFVIVGRPEDPDESLSAHDQRLMPGYFKTMGIPLLLGREFNESDGADSHPVAIINQKMAQRYFPNESPLGRHIAFAGVPVEKGGREIVGVVGDMKFESLEAE